PRHLVACAERRRKTGEGLGTVLLTTGEAKARVLITAARLGVISELVTDAITVKSILKTLER
ncbi:MAG TPA: hypothetical protein PKK84_04200, partial [Armatimonadota bacterium]|nr:hypothetical protein [Armatimonadota bacterium]